ncbi:hypothetical protein [Geobacter argillaceus]|uniref:Uncharacterized protein n=1 Tax=Geobacter argillaceus TaxID=345631 RepID=A0A562WSN9_9BACT|nr:hypothetical protein [Geobacter argillaceus]TWJ32444.1 hypothetical protein JN12_00884 [Geobacter argillaceus]
MKSSEGARICELTDANEIRSFATNPTAMCRRCGAKAHESSSLCDPVQIPEAGWLGD